MTFVIARLDALTTAANHPSGVGSASAATEFSARADIGQATGNQAMTVRELFTLGFVASAGSYGRPKPPIRSQLARGRDDQ
jgi:hypothetical protein